MPGESRGEAASGAEQSLDCAVVAGVVEAIEDPTLVCDATRTVVAWNDAFASRTRTDATVNGAAAGTFVEWVEADPLAAALAGREATAAGRLVGDGRRYSATARPLTREGGARDRSGDGDSSRARAGGVDGPRDRGKDGDSAVVGAVVTFEEGSTAEWSPEAAAIEHAADTLYVVDTDSRIQFVSEAFERSTKVPTEEVTGERFARLADYGVVDDAALDRARDALERVFAGETDEETFLSRPTVGTAAVAETRLTPVRRDGEVVGAVAVVRDVTEYARAEEALRLSRERLQTVLETLPVAVFVVDGEGGIDHVQGFDFENVPHTGSDLVGLPVEVFGDDADGFAAGCRRALDGSAGTATETVGERTLELFFEPVSEDGDFEGAIAVAVDVTDREEREQELAATNERLDLALSNTDAGVFEWYVDDDRLALHGSGVRLLDADGGGDDSLDAAVDASVHPEDRERVCEAFAGAVADDGTGELAVEFRTGDDGPTARWLFAEGEVHTDDDRPDRLVGTVREVTGRRVREKRLAEREQRLRAVIESSADPIAMQDTDGRYRVLNEAMVELAGCRRERLRGATAREVFDAATADRLEAHREQVLSTEGARVAEERLLGPEGGSDRIVQVTVTPHYGPEGDVQGTVTIARDITELERQRDELETLAEIQRLIHESIGALTSATTREGIKATVCDRLAESPFCEAAWVGSHDPSERTIEPDYATDRAAAYLEEVTVPTEPSETGQGPGGRAYRTGDLQVVTDVRDESFEPWGGVATEYGFESVLVVPLSRGVTTHGILVVYAGHPDAFSQRNVAGFEVLGEAVGFALSAARNRRLLEADSVLELEFEVLDDRPFADLSAARDCRFLFDSAVQTSEGHVVDYLTVEGVDPSVAAGALEDHRTLESMRRLEADGGPDFELTRHESVHQCLDEVGARGTRYVVADGTGSLVVEAPSDTDIRQVTDAVATYFDEVELTAKRERDRSETPWWQPRQDLSTRLTDRQRSVLQAAYYSGYYEWPRETDAETLADSLGVASTTLLQHLRKGHGRVLEAMFDS
jgi:PAS domain S-box-containing protein